jgi:arylsulfatase A-like enzyme
MRRAILFVLLVGCSSDPHPGASSRAPSVLFILTDDQGYGDLGCHGNDQIQTPHLDRLARESLELGTFYVSPVCSPTRASLLTGRYNYRTGVVDTFLGRSLMRADEVTLAEMLRRAGYRTGIFGKWHLGDHFPLRPMDRGFEETLVIHGGGLVQPSDPPGGDSYFNPTVYRLGRAEKSRGYCTDVFTDAALAFVEAHRTERFFAYVAYNAPHEPLQVPPEYLAPYASLPEATARLYAMVANIDWNVGRLLRKLDELELARDTIVIFMSDNGPQGDRFNAGLRGRKGTVFEGGIRVPFFLRWSARIEPRKDDRPFAHIDVTPTILRACQAPRPAGVALDGVDFLASGAPGGDGPGERALFFQWHRGDVPIVGKSCAARVGDYKLVWLDPGARPLLFNLRTDPFESHDLATQEPQIAQSLKERYEKWFDDVGRRGFSPTRLYLGSPEENPVVLTRQDWRGPAAGWAAGSVGHWEVEVARPGAYDITLRYRPLTAPGRVRFTLVGGQAEMPLPAGSSECRLGDLSLPVGPGRLEAVIEEGAQRFGPLYVEVSRR